MDIKPLSIAITFFLKFSLKQSCAFSFENLSVFLCVISYITKFMKMTDIEDKQMIINN